MQTETEILKKKETVRQVNKVEKDNCKDKKLRCKTLIIHGGKYRTTFTRKFENRKVWSKPNANHIKSYIPGTISELFINEGDIVKKGDKLLILEAMKMYNTIIAPHDAMIRRIHIRVGDKIPKGFLIIEFE